jgi:hypothetical protein
VRAAIGRVCSHPEAIDVICQGGRTPLSGPVLDTEHQALLSAERRVRGAQEIGRSARATWRGEPTSRVEWRATGRAASRRRSTAAAAARTLNCLCAFPFPAARVHPFPPQLRERPPGGVVTWDASCALADGSAGWTTRERATIDSTIAAAVKFAGRVRHAAGALATRPPSAHAPPIPPATLATPDNRRWQLLHRGPDDEGDLRPPAVLRRQLRRRAICRPASIGASIAPAWRRNPVACAGAGACVEGGPFRPGDRDRPGGSRRSEQAVDQTDARLEIGKVARGPQPH